MRHFSFAAKACLLAFTCCTSLAVTPATLAADFPTTPFIHVQGQASISLPPNQAELAFEIQALDADAEKGWQQLQERSEEIAQYLQNQNIKLQNFDVYDSRKIQSDDEAKNTQPERQRHRFLRSFRLLCNDVEKWQDLLHFLSTRPHLLVFSVNYGRDDQAQILQQLNQQAALDGKQQAQQLARALEVKLDKLSAASEEPLQQMAQVLGLQNNGAKELQKINFPSSKPDFSWPRQLHFKKQLNLIYRIKP